jgi:hypothetical protein
MLSKNLSLILIAFAATTPSAHVYAEYGTRKAAAILTPVMLVGPCIAATSVSTLRLAQQFKNQAQTLTPQALQKRGLIGLTIGTILSAPHAFIFKCAYDQDKELQKMKDEKEQLCPAADNSILETEK